MLRLVFAFIEIALHRRGPEQLPASSWLLAVVVIAYLGSAFAVAQFLELTPKARLVSVALDFALYCGFLWTVLKLYARERRWPQVLTALLGTEALLGFLVVPLLAWERLLGAAGADATLPALLWFIIVVWSVDIAAFVLARAIERPYALTVAVMLAYVSLTISLRGSLFPTVG